MLSGGLTALRTGDSGAPRLGADARCSASSARPSDARGRCASITGKASLGPIATVSSHATVCRQAVAARTAIAAHPGCTDVALLLDVEEPVAALASSSALAPCACSTLTTSASVPTNRRGAAASLASPSVGAYVLRGVAVSARSACGALATLGRRGTAVRSLSARGSMAARRVAPMSAIGATRARVVAGVVPQKKAVPCRGRRAQLTGRIGKNLPDRLNIAEERKRVASVSAAARLDSANESSVDEFRGEPATSRAARSAEDLGEGRVQVVGQQSTVDENRSTLAPDSAGGGVPSGTSSYLTVHPNQGGFEIDRASGSAALTGKRRVIEVDQVSAARARDLSTDVDPLRCRQAQVGCVTVQIVQVPAVSGALQRRDGRNLDVTVNSDRPYGGDVYVSSYEGGDLGWNEQVFDDHVISQDFPLFQGANLAVDRLRVDTKRVFRSRLSLKGSRKGLRSKTKG